MAQRLFPWISGGQSRGLTVKRLESAPVTIFLVAMADALFRLNTPPTMNPIKLLLVGAIFSAGLLIPTSADAKEQRRTYSSRGRVYQPTSRRVYYGRSVPRYSRGYSSRRYYAPRYNTRRVYLSSYASPYRYAPSYYDDYYYGSPGYYGSGYYGGPGYYYGPRYSSGISFSFGRGFGGYRNHRHYRR